MNVHNSSFIHNSPKLETTQMSVSRGMAEHTAVRPYHRPLLSNKKELLIQETTWMSVKRITLTEKKTKPISKAVYYTIPLTKHSQNDKI